MPKSKPRADQILLGSIVALQLVFSGFFIFDLGADVLGWRNIAMSWQFHEADGPEGPGGPKRLSRAYRAKF